MLAEKTLDDVASAAIVDFLERYQDDLIGDLGQFMYDRDIPEGDQAENIIEVDARVTTKLDEIKKVLGGTDG